MASLALIVSLMFLSVMFSGPLSLVLNYLNMPFLAGTLGAFSIVFGAYRCCVAPFPVSAIGALSALCGVITISKL